MATVSVTDLVRLRLASQLISSSEARTPRDVVHWMLAMQAQDFASATWAVGLRAPGLREAEVHQALRTASIVRSWPFRGTLHFIAGEDLLWMLNLTSERLIARTATRRNQLGLTLPELEQARQAAVTELAGGQNRTRSQLLAAIARSGVATDAQRGYHILWHLAQTGTLCFGPPEARQQTFVLVDEWVSSPRRLEREEALGELARRYFVSHGPATIRDLSWWSSIPLRDVQVGLELVRNELASVTFDDVAYYLSAQAHPVGRADAARLLPGFDEYLLGYQDRRAQLAAEHADLIVPGGNGIFSPTIVDDGKIAGAWKRSVTSRQVRISLTPFGTLSARAQRNLAKAAAAYGTFLDLPAEVQLGDVQLSANEVRARSPRR